VKRLANLKSYMLISTVSGLVVGVLVYFGTRFVETGVIAGLVTFIIALVAIATMDLTYKPDEQDPNKPRLR
jgi:energy-converting hydrogenase Eha subunit B